MNTVKSDMFNVEKWNFIDARMGAAESEVVRQWDLSRARGADAAFEADFSVAGESS